MRKPLSKKIRFEIFKRDSFTCQYCGGKAPEVVLRCDHIKPVVDGGDNDLMNLVTACEPCNQGKGARTLDDDSVVEKQRRQLEDLQARREQLEMLLEWRQGLADLSLVHVDVVVQAIAAKFGTAYVPSETGRKKIAGWVRRQEMSWLLDAVDACAEQYLLFDRDGIVLQETWNKAFTMIPRVAQAMKRDQDEPWRRDAFYVRGILRNRFQWAEDHQHQVFEELKRALVAGVDPDWIKSLAKSEEYYGHFERALRGATDDAEGGQ